MTDKYQKLRVDLELAIADAKRQGGVNERAEQIAALLAERDALAATPVSAESVVTLNGAQLLQALDFIAPDRDTDPQQLECELTISFADGPAGGGYYCYCTDYPDEGAIMLDAEATSAPVAAQPDLTQQTLDDVKAGIPARDAEIEALHKEIEALQAVQPRRLIFPTMLRKMWSGSEVQAWLDDELAKLTKSSSQQTADHDEVQL